MEKGERKRKRRTRKKKENVDRRKENEEGKRRSERSETEKIRETGGLEDDKGVVTTASRYSTGPVTPTRKKPKHRGY